MERSKKQRPKNRLGQAYDNADEIAKILFRRALNEAQGNAEGKYETRFRQTWQYEKDLNRIPYIIVTAAIEHINFSPLDTAVDENVPM